MGRVFIERDETMTIETNWQTRKLKVAEVAAIYGVSKATIWRWAKDGIIPAPQKIAMNTTRWDGSEVARHMTQNTTTA